MSSNEMWERMFMFNGGIADGIIYVIGMIVFFIAILALAIKMVSFFLKCIRTNEHVNDIYNRLDSIDEKVDNEQEEIKNLCKSLKLLSQKMRDFENNYSEY